MYAIRIRWRPPKYIREKTAEQLVRIREKYHIVVEGEDVPPPIESFAVSSNCIPMLPASLTLDVVGYEDPKQYNATFEEKQDRQTHTNSNTRHPYGVSRSNEYTFSSIR